MARETVSVTVTLELEVISREQLRHIAIRKLPDLDTTGVAAATRIVAGNARSIGVRVEEGAVGNAGPS
ncbi:hypothetical protein [Nocardia fluminea]|uniref:hypothetical protein n=1 Tax=Nocardia fluminea TaxID=134984 RepID=UPI0033EA5F3C